MWNTCSCVGKLLVIIDEFLTTKCLVCQVLCRSLQRVFGTNWAMAAEMRAAELVSVLKEEYVATKLGGDLLDHQSIVGQQHRHVTRLAIERDAQAAGAPSAFGKQIGPVDVPKLLACSQFGSLY